VAYLSFLRRHHGSNLLRRCEFAEDLSPSVALSIPVGQFVRSGDKFFSAAVFIDRIGARHR
jgi:hypothetical protein